MRGQPGAGGDYCASWCSGTGCSTGAATGDCCNRRCVDRRLLHGRCVDRGLLLRRWGVDGSRRRQLLKRCNGSGGLHVWSSVNRPLVSALKMRNDRPRPRAASGIRFAPKIKEPDDDKGDPDLGVIHQNFLHTPRGRAHANGRPGVRCASAASSSNRDRTKVAADLSQPRPVADRVPRSAVSSLARARSRPSALAGPPQAKRQQGEHAEREQDKPEEHQHPAEQAHARNQTTPPAAGRGSTAPNW